MKIFDTIAAVSTPRGKGGIAVIRISGPEAAGIADKVFFPKFGGKRLSDITPGKEVWGDIKEFDPDGKETCIDDGMGVLFRAPHSFTGEDTVEISCHGGILVTETVLEAVFAAGARPATAGEFTRRAFISGRMTLSQAKSLGDLLEAKTHAQLVLSRTGVNGVLSKQIERLYSNIRDVLSSIYAKIDFPDEDLGDMDIPEIISSLTGVRDEAVRLSKTYKTGRAISEGVRTVIAGRTNAGKSSLYNRLVGRDAAIVTDIEGTTRDLLEETVSFGGITLRLCDTAGLRETGDKVESIGVERAKQELRGAELVFAVFDGTKSPEKDDEELCAEIKNHGGCVIPVINKSDLCPPDEKLLELIAGSSAQKPIMISAKSGEGLDALSDLVKEKFTDGSIDLRYDAVVADARQYASLCRAAEKLGAVLDALAGGFALDLCCIDAEEAMNELGEINGHNVSEDIVSSIFSKFCVGK